MKTMRVAGVILGMATILFLSGCATIVAGGGITHMDVATNPAGAKVTVKGISNGEKVEKITPFKFDLNKNSDYLFQFELQDYKSDNAFVSRNISGWFWGNILLGGIIGMAIDYSTNNMWDHTTNKLNIDLSKTTATAQSPEQPAVNIYVAPQQSTEARYKAGSKYLGIGYDSSEITTPLSIEKPTASGLILKGGYFVSDNIDLNLSYIFGNWTYSNVSSTDHSLNLMVDLHLPLTQTLGGLIGIGYSYYTFDSQIAPSTTGSGTPYEVGIDAKLSNNLVGYLIYKGGSAPSLSLNGTYGGLRVETSIRNLEIGVNMFL